MLIFPYRFAHYIKKYLNNKINDMYTQEYSTLLIEYIMNNCEGNICPTDENIEENKYPEIGMQLHKIGIIHDFAMLNSKEVIKQLKSFFSLLASDIVQQVTNVKVSLKGKGED